MHKAIRHEIITAEEAAELLRVNISTFYRYVRSGLIPARKIGGHWKVHRKALLDFITKEEKEEQQNERHRHSQP